MTTWSQLFGVFFVLSTIVLPCVAQLISIALWVLPLRSRSRRWLSSLAVVCQAWNILDLFFVVLSAMDHDLGLVTAYSADTACQPLVELLPKFLGELLHPVRGPLQCTHAYPAGQPNAVLTQHSANGLFRATFML